MTKEPTARQKKAVKAIVENSRNKGEALLKAGYSKATAIKPTQVINSQGFQNAAKDFIKRLENEKNMALLEMTHKREKADYRALGSVVKDFTQLSELLQGKPTERVENDYRGLSEQDLIAKLQNAPS